MATIDNRLVHFKHKTDFETRLNNPNEEETRPHHGEILDSSIVFIQDANKIWTHGTEYYCGSGPVALESDLANYATTSSLTEGLAEKANIEHTHTTTDITDLSTILDEKADTSDLANYVTVQNGHLVFNDSKEWTFKDISTGSGVSIPGISMNSDKTIFGFDDNILDFTTTTDSSTGNGISFSVSRQNGMMFMDNNIQEGYISLFVANNTMFRYQSQNEKNPIICSLDAAGIQLAINGDSITLTPSDHILKVNNTPVSMQGHTHTTSDITDLSTYFDNKYLPLTGGTITSDLTIQGNVAIDNELQAASTLILNAANGSGEVQIKARQKTYLFTQGGLEIDGNYVGDATNSTEKRFLLGAETQIMTPQTNSNVNVYMQSGQLYATQMNSTNGFFETSDARLKNFGDDIQALEVISKIPTKYFTWRSDETAKSHIGTSAQELQKLYPDLVSEDSEGNLTVDYARLSVIALAAIKELDEKIKVLKRTY